MIPAIGELINASLTLQSVLIGELGGVEQQRALAGFDQSVARAAELRREIFGEVSQLDLSPEAPIPEPPASERNETMENHSFNPVGQL